jgi:hypothetical protein
MAVMAAGMHAAIVFGAMWKQVLLAHRQRVHVGAQADGARAVTAFEDADDAGSGQAAMHSDALRVQKISHPVAGALFLKGQFRVCVQVVAQGYQRFTLGKDFWQSVHRKNLLKQRRG